MTTEAVAIVTEPEKMTEPERRKFNDLDGIIRKGLQTFAEVGASLKIIKEQKLFREEYDSFEAYCRERCGWGRDRAYQLIEAHEVVAGLPTIVGVSPPANEAQARALIDVPPEQRAEVLTEAQTTARAEGKPVTAKRIRKAGERHALPKPKAEKPVPEPKPVENAEPVAVEAETEPTEDAPVEAILDFIRGQAIEPPTLTPEDIARAAAALTDDDVRRIREMKKLCLDLMVAYARRGLQVA